MPTLHEQSAVERHRAALGWIALSGLTHFVLSLAFWMAFCGTYADILARMTWSELSEPVIYPVLECTLPAVAFAVAFFLCRRDVPGRELVLTICVALACTAFLKDIHLSNAQIHVFVKMPDFWANDYYVTWWIYSAGPYLKSATRYSIAVTFFATVAGVIWHSWLSYGRQSRPA